MDGAISASIGALELAGSLCGVPYVGAAAIILRDIVDCCNKIAVQKVHFFGFYLLIVTIHHNKQTKFRQLTNKCAMLLNALNEQSSRLDGTDLNDAADEATAVLEKIRSRVKQWSEFSRLKSFLKNSEIQEGLSLCESEMDTALNTFHINAQISMHQFQNETRNLILSNHDEMRELLFQILRSKRDMNDIVAMQRAGEHVAESIMGAGQEELRLLRTMGLSAQTASENSRRYLQCQRGLIDLHKLTGIPPTVKRLDGEVTKDNEFAVAGGTYSDVWIGTWLGAQKVALKALRNIKANNPRAVTRFEHEIVVWSRLCNDYILPFYGIVTDLGQSIHMVSPWQNKGNVLDYVRKYPDADRMHLLASAAKGVGYLHSCGVTHGNLKCANILVKANIDACVCDFGMSKVVEEVTGQVASTTLTAAGSARWLAPELIEGIISSPTFKTDTYSYAMTILELVTLKHPYAHRKRDASVIHDVVVKREKPPRPTTVTDELWKLMEECWSPEVAVRPMMEQVAARMEAIERDSSDIHQR